MRKDWRDPGNEAIVPHNSHYGVIHGGIAGIVCEPSPFRSAAPIAFSAGRIGRSLVGVSGLNCLFRQKGVTLQG